MLEGLHPNNPTHVLRLTANERTARLVADLVMEVFDPAETAAAAFENEATGQWEVEVYFAHAPDEAMLRDLIAAGVGPDAGKALIFDRIAQQDWVRASLDGLSIVTAGRFKVHGAHDRAGIPVNAIGIEIEAALAFGTGHHGTTRGCLLMLDALLKRRRPRRVLDVGTGTGVLAIAAARALRRKVAAGDIDPEAAAAATGNARLNRVGALVRPVVARGLQSPALAGGAPYDLIFANILARPLMRLAPVIAAAASRDAEVILSGLIPRDVAGVVSAYRSQNMYLVEKRVLDGWATLRLRR